MIVMEGVKTFQFKNGRCLDFYTPASRLPKAQGRFQPRLYHREVPRSIRDCWIRLTDIVNLLEISSSTLAKKCQAHCIKPSYVGETILVFKRQGRYGYLNFKDFVTIAVSLRNGLGKELVQELGQHCWQVLIHKNTKVKEPLFTKTGYADAVKFISDVLKKGSR